MGQPLNLQSITQSIIHIMLQFLSETKILNLVTVMTVLLQIFIGLIHLQTQLLYRKPRKVAQQSQ